METTEINTENFGELIKWPQCVIVGKKITVEQAKEVLARTDAFFDGWATSNDRDYDNTIHREIGFDPDGSWEDHQAWRKKHGTLGLQYLENSYVSTCYFRGVHGWCFPDGTIFDNQNIGKWPSWEEIEEDCTAIAGAFPFLDMKVYLFNQEQDCEDIYDYEKKCVGGFAIEGGKVRPLDESEFLDPSSPYCKSESWKERMHKLDEVKKSIFGEGAEISKTNTFGPEHFFSEDEFREYFKKYFYE